MAYNAAFTNRIRECLSHVPKVKEKKMFRGITFMVNDKMCVSVGDNEMMCRVDPDIYEKLIQKNGCRPMIMKGREYKGYLYIHEDAVKTKKQLEYWINLALEFNKKLKIK